MSKKLDVSAIIAKHAQVKANRGGGNFLRIESGTTLVRMIPFLNDDGNEELFVDFMSHFLGKGVGSQTCIGDDCPLCTLAQSLKAEGKAELSKKIRAKQKYYFNVLTVGNDGRITDTEAKILECGPQLYDEMLQWFANPDWGNIADMQSGYVLRITKTGTGLNTEYKATAAKNPTPVPKGTEYGKNLHEVVKHKTVEELQDIVDNSFDISSIDLPESGDVVEENPADQLFGDENKATFGEAGFEDEEPVPAPPPARKPAPQAAKKPAPPPVKKPTPKPTPKRR